MALEHQNTTYEIAENLKQREKSKPSEKLGQTYDKTRRRRGSRTSQVLAQLKSWPNRISRELIPVGCCVSCSFSSEHMNE